MDELVKIDKEVKENFVHPYKDWTKKLFIPILILIIFVALQLFFSNKNNYTHNAVAVDAHNENKQDEKGKI